MKKFIPLFLLLVVFVAGQMVSANQTMKVTGTIQGFPWVVPSTFMERLQLSILKNWGTLVPLPIKREEAVCLLYVKKSDGNIIIVAVRDLENIGKFFEHDVPHPAFQGEVLAKPFTLIAPYPSYYDGVEYYELCE